MADILERGLLIASNPMAKAAALGALGGIAVGGTVGYLVGKNKRKKKSRQSKSKSRKKTVYHKRRNRKQRKPYTAGKRRDTSHRRIRYTKNNQPYIILRSGKARFISKKSARISRKRTGGKY